MELILFAKFFFFLRSFVTFSIKTQEKQGTYCLKMLTKLYRYDIFLMDLINP